MAEWLIMLTTGTLVGARFRLLGLVLFRSLALLLQLLLDLFSGGSTS